MIALCNGCVYLPDIAECQDVVPAQCPALPMPDAVPETVHLTIKNGHAQADAGGEKLVRDYVGLRNVIKQLWHDK